MMKFFKELPACLIGLEACASSHHWARQLSALGHTVKLIAPQFVKLHMSDYDHLARVFEWSTSGEEDGE